MSKGIEIILEGKKIHVVRENIELSLEQFDAFGDELNSILESGTGYFLIYDATKTKKYISGEVRIAMGKWLGDHEHLLKNNVISAVVIVPSVITQMVAKAVLAVKNPAFNYKLFTKEDAALEWINAEMNK